jgi:hypothetical protein
VETITIDQEPTAAMGAAQPPTQASGDAAISRKKNRKSRWQRRGGRRGAVPVQGQGAPPAAAPPAPAAAATAAPPNPAKGQGKSGKKGNGKNKGKGTKKDKASAETTQPEKAAT